MRGVIVVAAALVMLLPGCARNGPEPGSGIPVAETIEDVDYYVACGNEVLELEDGRRFSPFVDQNEVDEDADAGAPTPQAVAVPHGRDGIHGYRVLHTTGGGASGWAPRSSRVRPR